MGVLGLGRENHLSEFNDPLDTQAGVLSPSLRKAVAQANLGARVSGAAAVGAAKVTGMPAPATATGTATLTTAQVLNGVIVATPAGAAAYTLPLASDLATALPADFGIGDAFDFYIVSTAGANAITITTNTGWTLVGDMVVDTDNISAQLRVRRTAAATFTIYRVG